jgi:tetratricopeptide (TPR) repeat protein
MPLATFVWVALAFTLAVGCRGEPTAGPPQALSPDHVARNNLGVGLMGRFAFAEAAREFEALSTERPGWTDVDVNLAIAVLNRQGTGDLDRAERILRDRVLARDTDHRRGAYVLALLLLYAGRSAEAATTFRRVAEADPSNAFATYFLGQSLAASGQTAEALEWYRRTIALDPLFRSAYYGAFQALQRLGREADGVGFLKRFQDLEADPRAVVADFKYTRMGPLAEVATIDLAPAVAAPPVGPLFVPAARLTIDAPHDWDGVDAPATTTVVDVNDDGQLDVFVAGALASVTAPNALLLNQADGGFRLDTQTPLSRVTDVRAALWGDYDNDGLVDVFLCRPRGRSQLWRQVSRAEWRDVTRSATVSAPADAIDGAWIDADHDGDLDIWVLSRFGDDELLNNNGNGTFRRIGAMANISGDGRGSRGLALTDLDGDRDADVVVLRAAPPHDVYLNDRLWRYRQATGLDAFRHARIRAVVAGDVDADGASELYSMGPAGIDRWARDDRDMWQQTRLAVVDLEQDSSSQRAQLALHDLDGDGRLDLLATTGRSWMILDPSASVEQVPRFVANDAEAESVALAVLDPSAGPSIIGIPRGGPPLVWRPGPGRHAFLAITFSGRDSGSDQMRSNRSGIGTRGAIRTGSRWTVIDTWRSQSGPGQSLQPVAIGLGGASRADFVAVTWSDGVYQTELALDARALHTIEETQRQLSSCPVLFTFDGRGFVFVTDLLGVGGIGSLERPGVYGEPYPREHVLLPVDRIAPANGRYLLKIGEPMEEATYLDAAWLSVYDLPPGWQMTLDERKALLAPAPTGEPRFFMRDRIPIRSSDDRGQDVTVAIREADLMAAPPGRVDRRFIGRTETHTLTIEFDAALDEGDGEPLLVLDGWIEYPYAQTVFAAWQAGEAYHAPTLEARDGNGRWRTLLREFGYPAGMPRQMSVPLGQLPPGTRALRLSSSQEIYWDRVAVVYARSAPEVRHVRLAVASARLDASGFAQRTTGPQRTPRYDYQRRLPLWDTRHQRGWYTAFGPVEPLVADEDGAVAIFGPGEEIHLEFLAPPPPSPAWTRRVVLETRGWCKDMDLYTRDGETIEPLPGSPSPVRDQLHRRFNTRYAGGR